MLRFIRKHVVLFIILIIIILGTASIAVFAYLQLNKIKTIDVPKDNVSLGIDDDVLKYIKDLKSHANKAPKKIINIALFGDDRTDIYENGRSDCTMILSIDEDNKKVKVCSIMRDAYVNVDGYGMTKFTHAYAYGGPQLSIKTINQNFEMDIRDYVKVDFDQFEKIIDSIGGVQIEIKDYEIEGMEDTQIDKAGTYNLNGMQALAYSRIRYFGNCDYERTERQRVVLNKIFEKVKTMGVTNYPSFVANMLPLVETSLSKIDIIKIGTNMLSGDISDMEQFRIPEDSHKHDAVIDEIYYMKWDKEPTIEALHHFIFN